MGKTYYKWLINIATKRTTLKLYQLKAKLTKEQATKAQRESRGVALLFL
jgi:hypothetical protein